MCFTSNENWLQLNLIFFFLFQILSSSTKYCKCVCVRARACYCDEFNLNLLQETSVIECCANKRRESMEKSVKLVKPVQLVDFFNPYSIILVPPNIAYCLRLQKYRTKLFVPKNEMSIVICLPPSKNNYKIVIIIK
jgi:hypothetical protein